MKGILLLLTSMLCLFGYTQNRVTVYKAPPTGEIVFDDPANGIYIPIEQPVTAENALPLDYKTEQSKLYTVRVSSDSIHWTSLFVYTTYASNGLRTQRQKAAFTSFDFSGTVYVEVTAPENINFNSDQSLLIRPQSKSIIPYYKKGNIFRFSISNPAKLALEINGERDSALHIFANATDDDVPSGGNLKVFGPGVHRLSESNPANPNTAGNNKIYIQSGAVVIGDINTKNNDEIYIEGGGILKGEIRVNNIANVKIHGHGIIDLTNYAKQYNDKGRDFYHRNGIKILNSGNIVVNGITVNDSQLKGISIEESQDISIDNFKIFSRVIWGDGIYMTGTSNVTINDCFLRTSDDCIAIYASRRNQTNDPSAPFEADYRNRPAKNITVTNSSLYADAAHPVTIGWHGNYDKKNNGLELSNLNFENIDILEQDVAYLKSNGEYDRDYEGALSINCADGNKCHDITFKDIRIEDFSNGRLFSVKVEPAGLGAATTNGKKVSNIRFENISYNGTGESPSVIAGLSKRRPVDGVTFKNFTINGILVLKPSDYTAEGNPMIENRKAYNISFE